ncbi:hypothetical protein J2847_006450 [Azospirillum agricola]|uniref:hypothetical protein n=1 Tax=Azospirillum agricola TaxID=1720247 RepID=UPI001AE9482D|nr:hypothetical protein [Azospirillum agricola]MBP2233115.1 hypothetical protein [Azospirillum agricola]
MSDATSFSPRSIAFAMALGASAEALRQEHGLTGSELTEAVALFSAAIVGSNAQPGNADLVLSLLQLSMNNAAHALASQGLWFDPHVQPS